MEYTKIKKIHVAEAGTLSALLPMAEAAQLEVLILSGYLNTKDFDKVLDELCDFWPSEYDDNDNKTFDWSETPKLRVLDMGNCELVESTTLPDFGYHTQLDKIILPKNTEHIGCHDESVIYESFIKEIGLPETLKTLGGISGCERLERITIPESVEKFEMYALASCPLIEELHIPKNVRVIEGALLAGSENVTEITVSDDNPYFTSIDGVVYSKDLKTLVAYPSGNKRKSYKVLDGTVTLGYGAFNSSRIEHVILPNSLKTIEGSCFGFCSNLQELIIPDSVTKLGFRALGYCSNLTNLRLSSSLQMIEEQMFNRCDNLKMLVVPSSVKTMAMSALVWNELGFETIILQEGFEGFVCDHGNKTEYMFSHSSVLRKINLPSTVKHLPTGIFRECSNLELQISEHNPYFKVQDGAIYTKDGKVLVAVTNWDRESFSVADGTEVIGEACFWRFSKLQEIHIPSTLRKIESRAFDSCIMLKQICLPECLEEIEYRAFDGCDNLTTIKLWAKQPPQITGICKDDQIASIGKKCFHIYVPKDSVQSYIADPKWNKWKIEHIEYNMTSPNSTSR